MYSVDLYVESIEVHLLHPHTWVRLAASQMLGTVFASWSPEQLVKVAQQKTEGIIHTSDLLNLYGVQLQVYEILLIQICVNINCNYC